MADETGGGPLHPDVAARGQTLRLTGQILAMTGDLLPTPVAQPSGNTPEDHLRKKPGRKQVTDLAIIAENDLFKTGGKLLPTPDAYSGSRGGSQHPNVKRAGGHQVTLQDVTEQEISLLPTPNTMDMLPRRSDEALARAKSKGGCSNLKDVEPVRNPSDEWGKYEPAIHRWGAVLGREAPAPTQVSPRGKPQLAPAFVEWMMGLEKGWVTDPEIGLTRNEQLRALGNGVVPQQAMLALERISDEQV